MAKNREDHNANYNANNNYDYYFFIMLRCMPYVFASCSEITLQ